MSKENGTMNNWEAFGLGLLLGDDSKPIGNFANPNQQKELVHTNIPLQDIVFCQALRNIYDEAVLFVQEQNPTAKQFIDFINKEPPIFDEPLTDHEKRVIESNKESVKNYLRWVNGIGENAWRSLSVLEKIWQTTDFAHIPDMDHLDMIFGLDPELEPIKKNGRLYEYDSTTHIAKNFFNGDAAQIVSARCHKKVLYILSKSGYTYDYRRDEYDHKLSTNKNLSLVEYKKKKREQMLERRRREYLSLLKKEPEFVLEPWSDITLSIRTRYFTEKKYAQTNIEEEEINRRQKELKAIYSNLTKEQKMKMKQEVPLIERRFNPLLLLLYGFTIILLIFGISYSASITSFDKKESFDTGFLILFLFYVLFEMFASAIDFGIMEARYNILAYLRVRQQAFYLNLSNCNFKAEYEKLLIQSKNLSESTDHRRG